MYRFFILLSLSACSLTPTEVLVDREVNFSFADDFSEAIVVVSRYTTTQPEQPFYNDSSAQHYRVLLKRTSTNNQGRTDFYEWTESFTDSQTGEEVEIDGGGNIAYAPVYWLKSRQRLIGEGFDLSGAFILELDSGKRRRLDPNAAFQVALGKDEYLWLSNAFTANSIIPSPDSEKVAVLFQAAYEGNSFYDLRFKNLLAFYRVSDASLIMSGIVPTTKDEQHVQILNTYTPNSLKGYNLLWSPDGQGVFLPITTNVSFFASADSNQICFIRTNLLPQFPYPPRGGPFLPDGTVFEVIQSGNESHIELTKLSNWFSQTNLLPLNQIDYVF